jgi:hypothetical protein
LPPYRGKGQRRHTSFQRRQTSFQRLTIWIIAARIDKPGGVAARDLPFKRGGKVNGRHHSAGAWVSFMAGVDGHCFLMHRLLLMNKLYEIRLFNGRMSQSYPPGHTSTAQQDSVLGEPPSLAVRPVGYPATNRLKWRLYPLPPPSVRMLIKEMLPGSLRQVVDCGIVAA